MEANSKYSNHRSPGREHFPLYPKGFIAIRIVQLVLALVVIGLAAYGVSILALSSEALILFTAIATLITCVYIIVSEFGAPALYNYWAVLALDIFLVILWLISFAVLASDVAYLSDYLGYTYYYVTVGDTVYVAILAAAAGIGGVEFVLFIVSLAIHSIMLHRHRKAGLHCSPIKSAGGHDAPVAHGSVPVGGEKPIAQTQGQQYPQQNLPPQSHAGQPTPQPQQAYAPPQQQYYPQQAPPQQVPSPLSAQPTGGSIPPPTTQQHYQVPSQPNAYEVHGKSGHFQGPYEAHGQSVHQPGQ